MKTIMQGRDSLNNNGNEKMKKTHVQIITLIMLMSVSTEYLQASKPAGAPKQRGQQAKTVPANRGFSAAFKKNVTSKNFGNAIATQKSSTPVASAAQPSQAASKNSGISLGTAKKPNILADMSPESIETLSKAGMAIKTAQSNAIISEAGLNIARAQKQAQAAAQPAPSLWSSAKIKFNNMFGKKPVKIAAAPALTPTKAVPIANQSSQPSFYNRFKENLNLAVKPKQQTSIPVVEAEVVEAVPMDSKGGTIATAKAMPIEAKFVKEFNKDGNSNAVSVEQPEVSYYGRAKAAVNNAASVAYHTPGALVAAAGGQQKIITGETGSLRSLANSARQATGRAGSAVYNAPGKVSVALGGKQDFITNKESGSLRSLSGYDTYNPKAGQPGQTGWNFATKANQNYTKKTSDFMADNLETTSNGMVRAKPVTQVVSAEVINPLHNSATGEQSNSADFNNPEAKQAFADVKPINNRKYLAPEAETTIRTSLLNGYTNSSAA